MNRYGIGLFGRKTAGWEMLLRQEGVPYSVCPENISNNDLSAVIIADDADEKYDPDIKNYLKKGGGILCSAEIFNRLTEEPMTREYIKYLLPEKDSPFVGIWLIDVKKKCALIKRSNFLRSDSGTATLYLGEYSGGWIAVLPFDGSLMMGDVRSVSKSFYGKGTRLPHEIVSTVSKGTIRAILVRCLEEIHHKRGIPYIHLWYYPTPENSSFGLRIDTDFASAEEVQRTYRLLQASGVSATWFVDVKSQQNSLSLYKNMTDQEVSLHCYEHKTYADYTSNDDNIRKALMVMRNYGIVPHGFASPYGKWNDAIARAVMDNKFEYSSEFAYDYDNLPSAPSLESGFSCVPQIPIHPVSIGSLRRQGYDIDSMKEYYKMVLDHHIAGRIPAILYHHPKDGNEDALKFVFDYVKEKQMKTRMMVDVARWWKKRSETKFDLFVDHDALRINDVIGGTAVLLRITRPDGAEVYSEIASRIELERLEWRQPPPPQSLPADISRIRSYNPRILINTVEDLIHKLLK